MLKKLLLVGAFSALVHVHAHVGNHASVHDTVAGVVDRLRKSGRGEAAMKWKAADAERYLTPEDKEVLANEHIRFTVDQPVRVYVVRGKDPSEELFWLQSRGFTKTDMGWTEEKVKLGVWQKDFSAGEIGLGVNSLTGGGTHYAVILQPKAAGSMVKVSDLYPGRLRVAPLKNGVHVYSDSESTKFSAVPESLAGATLIQTVAAARNDGKLIDLFRRTKHPSTTRPDQVILTWSDDPRTTQTIQWRTSTKVKNGSVKFQRKRDASSLHSRRNVKTVKATTERLTTLMLLNDPMVNRHTATLRELEPDTAYVYSVGSGGADGWSEEFEFTTAPAEVKPFSFMYMGDAQNGLDRWGSLLKSAYLQRPDAAFYIMAGDLVNRGADRDDWDDLFHNSKGIYDRRQLVPVIGNHECQGGHPTLYLKHFTIPTNGPNEIEKERAYSFEYSNALFVVLDSNLPAATQTNWLARTLANSKATWKFVTYHHPAYSSAKARNNAGVKNLWTPIFDKYHVDLALQGHDHAYLRTYPMNAQKRVEKAEDGTIYIVSVSGPKFYDQGKFDYTAVGMTNVATFQVLDIQISGDRLLYRAYDADRTLRDEFVIEKKAKATN